MAIRNPEIVKMLCRIRYESTKKHQPDSPSLVNLSGVFDFQQRSASLNQLGTLALPC
jgi:hypothetical protein